MFPIDKYNFYQAPQGKIIAASTYAGRTVRGVAKCHVNDSFSLEKGKELAAARCNEKVALKRVKRAKQKVDEARTQLWQAERYYDRMDKYLGDANRELVEATGQVDALLNEM